MKELEEEATLVGNSLRSLEINYNESVKRERELEDKIAKIGEEYEETVNRADAAESRVSDLEREADAIDAALEKIKEEHSSAEAELCSTIQEFEEM